MINLVHTLALAEPVQVSIVTATGAVMVALVGVGLELLRRSHKKMGEVKEQVANSHSTNLRDDIDRVIEAVHRIEHTAANQTQAILGIRADLRQEREERHELEKRFDRFTAQ